VGQNDSAVPGHGEADVMFLVTLLLLVAVVAVMVWLEDY
jgi:hypothetical protein